MSIEKFANPAVFLRIANAVLPYVWAIAAGVIAVGLYGALVTSPPHWEQGEAVRIMYIHVPAAYLGMQTYGLMAMASAVAIIFRHPLADMVAKAAAPLGAVFCLLALITGAIWGKPEWGTYWAWDARITSMFILMLLYLGYIALWEAIDDPHLAASIARIVAIAGSIILPIIKFSVDWWHTLHQPATLTIIKSGQSNIHSSMLWPLLTMIAGFFILFVALLLVSVRTELALRKQRTSRLTEMARS